MTNKSACARRRGGTIAWVAIVLVVLLGFLGLTVDVGYAYFTGQKLQAAADAAALAGAHRIGTSAAVARAAALEIAAENEAGGATVQLADNPGNDPDGYVVTGVYDPADRSFTPSTEVGTANAVLVRARRTEGSPAGPLPLFFGPLIDNPSLELTRWAIAVGEGGPAGPGIIMLKSSGIGLQHSGNGTVTVHGPVQINSAYNEALNQSGNGVLDAVSYEVVGQIYDSTTGGLPGEWNEGADPVADPYAALPVPVLADYPVIKTSNFAPGPDTTLLPGRYQGGISLGSNGTYTLQPGIYIIEGGGFKVSSPCTLIAQGVMIYNCGTNGGTSNADQFTISGDAHVTWTPISGGTYDGFGLFQHRDIADKKVQISGNGNVNITCIIYAKSAEVQLSGNGTTDVLGGGFVAASMQISGDGTFSVGGDDAGGPGSTRVYLVE